MSSDDRAQIGFEVDKDAKELIKRKLDHGELSDILREEVYAIAYGQEVGRRKKIQKRLEQIEQERIETREELERAKSKLSELNEERERLEQELANLSDIDQQYQDLLEEIEQEWLAEGKRVFVGHGKVEKAANLKGCDQEEIIQELKERNPNLPEKKFTEKLA